MRSQQRLNLSSSPVIGVCRLGSRAPILTAHVVHESRPNVERIRWLPVALESKEGFLLDIKHQLLLVVLGRADLCSSLIWEQVC